MIDHATTPPEAAANRKLGTGLKQRHVTMISLGGIIGAGLFVGSSAAISTIGPATPVTYALAGLLVLLVMRMIGELAVSHPGVGSFTDFVRIGLGDLGGFVSGWLYAYFWLIVVAIEAIAGAAILQRWIPGPMWVIALALTVIMVGINCFSVKSYGEAEFWFASIKVAAIIAFIALGASYMFGWGRHDLSIGTNLMGDGGFAPFGIAAIVAGIPTVIFAICGAEIATIAAAESDEPAKSVAAMTKSVIVRVMLFYVLSMSVIVCIVPWRSIVPGESPFVAAMDVMNIPGAADILTIVVAVAVLSCMNSGIFVCSRVVFRLAEKHDAPHAMCVTTSKGVPRRAIIASGLVAYAAVGLSVVSPNGVFLFLVNASGAVMLLVYGLVAAAQLRLRLGYTKEEQDALPLKMWLFPGLTIFTIVAILAILVAMGLDAALRPQLVATLVATAALFVVYLARRTTDHRQSKSDSTTHPEEEEVR
ncbi:amino acid permease [Rhodococcus sp. ABRD24]|uniref:amino acid permease n=1 Tax=Rhodococcus sp. ABRD24 TaxID=2507582 RepID=UPI0010386B1E|nr:amino acid permease [Rhodococcus sp. ABRD24]QBJ96006.1 amino acid permease [Rhodococcus sp. ABRD24]